MKCAACGAAVRDAAVICRGCGRELPLKVVVVSEGSHGGGFALVEADGDAASKEAPPRSIQEEDAMPDECVNQVYLTALGGLLHDIGKFSGRAGAGKREMTTKEALQEVVYEHALYSDSFVQEYVPEEIRRHLSAPRRHHNPQSEQDYRVQLADWLSSGEREEEEGPPVPYLLSVFARLKGHNARAYLPLGRLDPTGQGIFPREVEPGEWREEYRREYARLWGEFTADCQALQSESDLGVYLESIYHLLGEFTWCIPSAWRHSVPDVSLYDHARTTAAIAACLAADGRDVRWCQKVLHALKEKGGATSEEVCLLVAGDINGVQSFLYTLASAGAAKGLRARSFYLQLLSEAVARYVLDRLDLPPTNLLYVGGGVFEILAPICAARTLEEVRQEVALRLLHIHGGALGLTLEWVALQAGEFAELRPARRRLNARLGAAKQRPFAAIGAGELAQHMGQALPFDQGGTLRSSCQVCGAPGVEEKCSFCRSLEELGADLPRATHLVVFRVPPADARRAEHWRDGLATLGADAYLVAEGRRGLEVPKEATLARVWRFAPGAAKDEARSLGLDGLPCVQAYRPMARLTPWRWNGKEGRLEIATFEDLAEESARGIARWGVLRMDMDNLGELFGCAGTLSRSAALSRALQVFFEGYLPSIGKEWNAFSQALQAGRSPQEAWGTRREPGPRDRLYVQYAGGDDLFLVGAWDALPEFADRLRQELGRYACGNPAVTLSAGISLADSKYPLYQAALEAGEAEDASKDFVRPDGRRKDALTFLGQTIGWEEFAAVREQAYQLAEWCSRGLAPRALLQLLLSIDAEWRRGLAKAGADGRHGRGKARLYFGRWMWQLVYHLTRAARRSDENIRGYIAEMQEDILGTGIATIGLTARWAQLLIRGK